MLQNQVRPFASWPAEVVWEGTVNVKQRQPLPPPWISALLRSERAMAIVEKRPEVFETRL